MPDSASQLIQGRFMNVAHASPQARYRYLDPETLEVDGRIQVLGGPDLVGVMKLNELEYVAGAIYANVWPTNYIVKIDPASGFVTGWANLAGLLGSEQNSKVDVLNGIAYDAQHDRLFVTGKFWPSLFQIRLSPGN